MNPLMMKMMEDAKTANAPSDTELTEIAQLAENQLFLEGRVKEIEDLLSETKEQLRLVQEVHIPEAMNMIGMKKFTLSNGYSITVKEDVYASIRKDFMENAVQWLDNNGLGGIVKDQVSVDFGRGEFDNVSELLDFCRANKLNAVEKLSVHPATLKATVKEQMCRGLEFPAEFFSIAPVNKAVIKK